jgi:hypothetical protein
LEVITVNRKKFHAIKNPKPKAIIVCCSDPRFRTAFHGFIVEELELTPEKYVLI